MEVSAEPYDEIQSHIIGIIVSLMTSYNLNLDQVKERYEYILSLDDSQITYDYQKSKSEQNISESEDDSSLPSSDDQNINELESIPQGPSWGDSSDGEEKKRPIYVTTRREFCHTMQQGIKICPRYSSCNDNNCKNFHVRPEFICPHVTRGSYCHVDNCELIVIRACHKGKKCNDAECSFRHR